MTATRQATENVAEHAGGDGGKIRLRDTALEMLTRAVAGLTAEVKCLRDENERLREQMAAMAAQQEATSRLMTGLRPQGEFTQHHARWPPELQTSAHDRAPTPAMPMALVHSSTSSSTTTPAAALVEAMRELPFLRDYPQLTGFAIPNFRHIPLSSLSLPWPITDR
jgi:hypothetical protein